MAISQIPALPWEIIFGRPSFGRSTPTSNGNSQIPVKFIFHSYSKSSTFGWPGVGRSTPHKYWFHRWLFIESHAAPADHLALHLQISPLNGNFTDSCSDSSYFIPTLRAQHLADQVLTGLPPIQWWFYRFLFWQLTTLRAYHSTDHV